MYLLCHAPFCHRHNIICIQKALARASNKDKDDKVTYDPGICFMLLSCCR